MFTFFSRYTLRPAGWLLLALFAVSFLWCGDAGCREGTGDGACASPLCALLMTHHDSDGHQGGAASTECHCVCHMPTIPVDQYCGEPELTMKTAALERAAAAPSSPGRSIYHPPKS